MTLCVKKTETIAECVYLSLLGDKGHLLLGHSNGTYYLRGSDGKEASVSFGTSERDWLTFGISQSETERKLFVNSLNNNKTYTATVAAEPIGNFDRYFLYAKTGG